MRHARITYIRWALAARCLASVCLALAGSHGTRPGTHSRLTGRCLTQGSGTFGAEAMAEAKEAKAGQALLFAQEGGGVHFTASLVSLLMVE